MKDLTAILAAAGRLAQSSEEAVLVTLIKTIGSSYRKPGARMLILPGCRTIGTISGGCLEPAVARQAWDSTRNGHRIVFTHDSSPEDDHWSPASGCHGKLFLLAEPFRTRHPTLDFIRQIRQSRRPAFILHHFQQNDQSLIPAKTEFFPDLSQLPTHLVSLSPCHPVTPRSQWLNHIESPAFLELVPPPPHLLICGAGDDARPLAQIAHELGWLVTILDTRERFATKERFPTAEKISAAGPAAIPTLLLPHSVAIIMSHRYLDDQNYLEQLLKADGSGAVQSVGPLPYIGILGPRRRTDQILSDLADRSIPIPPTARSRIHTPAGLNLGGEGPEPIALAILAQIQSILNNSGADAPIGRPHICERDSPKM